MESEPPPPTDRQPQLGIYSDKVDKNTGDERLTIGLQLNEQQYRDLSKDLDNEATAKGFSKEMDYNQNNVKKTLNEFVNSMIPSLRDRFEPLTRVQNEWLFKALRAMILKKRCRTARTPKTASMGKVLTSLIRRPLILRDIRLIVRRLESPDQPSDQPLGVIATDFCWEKFLETLASDNLTGIHIDERKWWEQEVVGKKGYDSALEEVCYYNVEDNIEVAFDSTLLQDAFRAAISDALSFARMKMFFLIRPRGSKDGRELLGVPTQSVLGGSVVVTGKEQLQTIYTYQRRVNCPSQIASTPSEAVLEPIAAAAPAPADPASPNAETNKVPAAIIEVNSPQLTPAACTLSRASAVVGDSASNTVDESSVHGVAGVHDTTSNDSGIECSPAKRQKLSPHLGSLAHRTPGGSPTHFPAPGTPSNLPSTVIISSKRTVKPAKAALNVRTLSNQPTSIGERCGIGLQNAPQVSEKVIHNNWRRRSLSDVSSASGEDAPLSTRRTQNDVLDGDEDTDMQSDSEIEETNMDDDEQSSEDDTPVEEMSEEQRAMLVEKLKLAPACSQLTEELWVECCEFFRHDPSKRARKDVFHLRGFKEELGLYNYQAFGAFWLYRQGYRGCDGAILADDMGLGKTVTSLTVWLANGLLYDAWKDVQNSWRSDDKSVKRRHVPQNNQEPGAKCPSQHLLSISCPCRIGGISYRLAQVLKPGPWLCLAPANNVGVWEKECKQWLDLTDKTMDLKVIIAHGINHLSVREIELLKNDKLTSAARDNQHKLLVITSTQSVGTRIANKIRRWHQTSPRKGQWQNDAVSWGGIFHDEAHEAKNKNTMVNQYLLKQSRKPLYYSHVKRPLIFGMTGTPYERDPSDLSGHLQSLATEEWSVLGSEFANCTMEKLYELSSDHARIVQAIQASACSDGLLKSYSTKLANFMKGVTLRRNGDDFFFGEKILSLPSMKVNFIKCHTKPEYREAIEELLQEAREEESARFQEKMTKWAQKPGRRSPPKARSHDFLHGKAFDTRLCAGFPAIASLRSRFPEWTFRAEEIDWDNLEEPTCLYRCHLQELVQSSSKIIKLSRFLDGLLQQSKDERANGEEPTKVIILTHSPAIQAIIWLWLKIYRPDIKAVNFHAKLSLSARARVLDGFCDRKDSKGAWIDAKAHEALVLLGSTKPLRTGHNAQRASVIITFDPEWTRKDQMQAFGRVHRTGQKKETLLYLLYDPDNLIERKIIERQRARGMITDTSWNILLSEAEAAQIEGRKQVVQRRPDIVNLISDSEEDVV